VRARALPPSELEHTVDRLQAREIDPASAVEEVVRRAGL
jgi:hypothetical protein